TPREVLRARKAINRLPYDPTADRHATRFPVMDEFGGSSGSSRQDWSMVHSPAEKTDSGHDEPTGEGEAGRFSIRERKYFQHNSSSRRKSPRLHATRKLNGRSIPIREAAGRQLREIQCGRHG